MPRVIWKNFVGILAPLVISGLFLRSALQIDWQRLEPIDFVNIVGLGLFVFLTINAAIFPYIIIGEGNIIINKITKVQISLNEIQDIKESQGLFANILIMRKNGSTTKIDAWQLRQADIDFLKSLVPGH